jgi:hypothetical protein
LGVPFKRAQQGEICVNIPLGNERGDSDYVLLLEQSEMGILGISTVVWDSGLLMVDYLISRKERQIIQSSSPSSSSMPSASNSSLGTCLDLGCGTGVVGIAALLLGADKCVFSDKSITPCLRANVLQLPIDLWEKVDVVEYDWNNEIIPSSLTCTPDSSSFPYAFETTFRWTTILCSDILYEQFLHDCLTRLISRLKFHELILGYKRRQDHEEKKVIESLEAMFDVELIEPSSFELRNVQVNDTAGLYILVISPLKT